MASSAGAVAPTFEPARALAVGGSAGNVAVADVNRDGRDDLVVASSPGISVLLGAGGGRFGAPVHFSDGTFSAVAVAVADFNGDGKPDVAAEDGADEQMAILLGDGAGGFGSPTRSATPSGPSSIPRTGDFNRDGHADIATLASGATFYEGRVSVLLGDGAGHLGSPINSSTGPSPADLATGDFNRDGITDAVTANSAAGGPPGPAVSVLHGDGSGAFTLGQSLSPTARPERLAVGRFDGDSYDDVAVLDVSPGHYFEPDVSVSTTHAGTGLSEVTKYPLSFTGQAIVSGDFNRDGHRDLLVEGDGHSAVLLGDGTGRFQGPVGVGASDGNGLATGDFNQDGKPDLVSWDGVQGVVSVRLNSTRPAGPAKPVRPKPGRPPADVRAPRLSHLGFSRARFRVSRRGTIVGFRLSEPARVRFTVQRRTRRGHYRRIKGAFRISASKGRWRFTFHGIVGGKALGPGRYRLTATATDAAGNHSITGYRRFRILHKH